MITMDQNAALQSAQQINIPQPQNIDDNKQAAVQEQSLESASVSASPETISAAIQTPAPEIHPVMSFFKTLVTPNKSVSKSEEEVTGEADDKKKENGGLRKSSSKKEKTKSTVQQTAETSDKGLRKSESPKSRTLSRLFRQKTKKEEQQPSSSNIAASEDDRKADKAPATRPKPFWRKASADPGPQSSKGDSASTGNKSQESSGKKTEDGKNAKPKLMMFFKQLTLDITDGVEVSKGEKTVVTAVVEPPPQKGKENLKEKKASAEKLNKQESRESPETTGSIQFQAPDAVFVQNGGESSKDGQLKKVEKRQSLGSFFKAIGPKRMCDAEVQTDPVSVYPAEKAK